MFCIEEINEYLPKFPVLLGQMAVKLSKMEVSKLIWRAIPRKWQVQLKDRGIKCHQISQTNFITEIEMIQAIELQMRQLNKSKKSQIGKHESSNHDKGPQKGAGAKHKKIKSNKNKRHKPDIGQPPDDENTNFCLRHSWNTSHVMDECKVLKAEANKMRHVHAVGSKESRKKVCDSFVNISKKDLNALIDKCIASNKKKPSKSLTFTSLKKARKYLAAHEESSNSLDSE